MVIALGVYQAAAFVPATGAHFRSSQLRMAAKEVDVGAALTRAEELGLLSKVSELGLLSKAEKLGIKLSTVTPLLKLADEEGLVYVAEELADDVVPLLPEAIEAAPKLLPLAAAALNIPPSGLYAAALLSLGAGAAEIYFIPDDSVMNVALQTFLAVPLLLVAPGASVVGATILNKIKD